jgi:hypothetical protein
VSPEDRLARFLRALDELPSGARRLLAVVVSLLLLGLLIAAVALAPSPEQAAPRPSSGDRRPIQRASEPGVPAARAPARRFLEGYLAFSYGHGRLSAIADADPLLLRALQGQRVPPAARKRHPRILALRVDESAPGVARATATIADGSGIRYPLVFYLDRRPAGWLVTRLAD